MFSFLHDEALYGEGRADKPPNPTVMGSDAQMQYAAAQRAQISQRQPIQSESPDGGQGAMATTPPSPAGQLPDCVGSKDLEALFTALNTRIEQADRRAALMEQRLLTAIRAENEREIAAQKRTQPGCSWGLFVFVLMILTVLWLFGARSSPAVAIEPTPATASFPVVLPTHPSVPASPLVFPISSNAVAPATFLRTPQ